MKSKILSILRPPLSPVTSLDFYSNKKAAELIVDELISSDTLTFKTRESMRRYFMDSKFLEEFQNTIMEFGVHNGSSILQIANNLNDKQRIFGFDAFEGIRDAWSKPDRPPGSMNLNGQIPAQLLEHKRIHIVKGWIEDTLPNFLKNINSISFAHLDMDVYKPTKFALESIIEKLDHESVLLFDDFFGFIGWQHHSAKAFFEIFEKKDVSCIGVSPFQAAFRIHKITQT